MTATGTTSAGPTAAPGRVAAYTDGLPLERFGLGHEHGLMRETLRALVSREVRPLADAGEANRSFPREVIPLLARHELLGLKYPVELGGQGLDILAECLLIEELTRASAGVSAGVFAHAHLGVAPILGFGSAEQREQWAHRALRGEQIAGFALSEPAAGSDVQAIRTRAVPRGGDYLLNGSKLYVTNGTIADYLVVAAYTRPDAGRRGISIFIVPTDVPGVERRALRKLGNWSSDTAEIFFDDVAVPSAHRIGEEEDGFARLMRTLTEGRVIVATRGLALAEDAFERALAYAREREAFGRPISDYQAISHRLARLAVDIDAARLLIHRAAHLAMAGRDCATAASKAKL